MLPTRPIPKSCTKEPMFLDPSSQVGQAMGGRGFFSAIEARFLHRVGMMSGLGWELPYGSAKDGINYVRIAVRKDGCGTYDVLFGRRTDMREGLAVGHGIVNPFGIQTVRTIEDVHPANLREVYDRETITQEAQ